MNKFDILLSPPVAFIIFLGLTFLIYALGRGLAPKLKNVGGKLKTYACGEDIPGVKIQWGYRLFFFIALFFTIMHVAALVMATVPAGKILFFSLIYLVMIFLSVVALVTRSS
jgi:NADH:ubiquinone oxidoreductase subunit 3 (subunit A)